MPRYFCRSVFEARRVDCIFDSTIRSAESGLFDRGRGGFEFDSHVVCVSVFGGCNEFVSRLYSVTEWGKQTLCLAAITGTGMEVVLESVIGGACAAVFL